MPWKDSLRKHKCCICGGRGSILGIVACFFPSQFASIRTIRVKTNSELLSWPLYSGNDKFRSYDARGSRQYFAFALVRIAESHAYFQVEHSPWWLASTQRRQQRIIFALPAPTRKCCNCFILDSSPVLSTGEVEIRSKGLLAYPCPCSDPTRLLEVLSRPDP